MELPEHVVELLESMQAQIKALEAAGAPTEAARREEARLQKMGEKSRFQGLGDPLPNPNVAAMLKYPGWRFRIAEDGTIDERLVMHASQEPKEEGWYRSMQEVTEALAAKGVEKVDGRTKAARDAKKEKVGA
jgi:hypothetical protein